MQHLAGRMGKLLTCINRSFISSVINASMDSTLEKPAQSEQDEYGLEVLCASWNPLAAAIAEPVEAGRDFAAELTTSDAESFLASFYRSQQG